MYDEALNQEYLWGELKKTDLKGEDTISKKSYEENATHWSGAAHWKSWLQQDPRYIWGEPWSEEQKNHSQEIKMQNRSENWAEIEIDKEEDNSDEYAMKEGE